MDDGDAQDSPGSRPSTAHRIDPDGLSGLEGDSLLSQKHEASDAASGLHEPADATAPKHADISPANPPASAAAESSFADDPSLLDSKHMDSLAEAAVREHLQDVESSFAAPPSPIPISRNGVDDTFLFDSPSKKPAPASTQPHHAQESAIAQGTSKQGTGPSSADDSLPAIREESELANTTGATSSLEAFSSSPTAAAAARTVSRALSQVSGAGTERGLGQSAAAGEREEPESTTPRTADFDDSQDISSQQDSLLGPPAALRHMSSDQDLSRAPADAGSTPGYALRYGKRPKYLRSRNASQRSSVSSFNTDPESDVTVGVGADYALQSGGALPALGLSRSSSNVLSRSISMGSMASGIDDFHDSSGPGRSSDHLAPLEEHERSLSPQRRNGHHHRDEDDLMQTPKAKRNSSTSLAAPTDTVIARHVRNVQVPESLAREYKNKGGLMTPRKPSEFSTVSGAGTVTTTGSATAGRHGGRNLTLKEQSSTIERLSKENFDLKLKVMFLSDRLDKLSEEGIKEMISENVELKTGLAVLQRDNKVLRRRVKELERQLKDQDERPSTARSGLSDDEQSALLDQEAQEREEELVYLRERVEEYSIEIERLRAENMGKEAEKRRMAEVVRSLGERTGENLGREEEADVWKDLLEQETARREQGDEDNRRLREEIFRLKQELTAAAGGAAAGSATGTGGGLHHTTNIYNITKKSRDAPGSPTRPVSSFSGELDTNGTSQGSTLVEELRRESEQLRHENAELRREVGAQTSMLTSRNREKERLYQEIEDLKMAQRRGGPAPSTVDSILERSASRAGAHERSASRASGGTRVPTVVDDPEREELEAKMAEARDKNNELKLQNQELQRELDACMEDFETAVAAKKQAEELVTALQEDVEAAMNDLMALQAERDEALQEHANLETEFEALRREAQEEIDALEGEADQRTGEIERLQLEVSDRTENLDALQDEMRRLSEALVRLEDEQENKLRRIQQLEQDLGEANKELEELENKLLEANDKANRLAIQQESSQGEIAFLREEQEGDKIRIGDLEAALANAEQSLREEKDRAKELEGRLSTERRQREILATREKEEVQQYVNELNREMSAAKDESRKLRKQLSSREVEATEWKERLMELENNLREALGDLNGTRSSLLKSIAKLQRELENTVRELDVTKSSILEKDRIIKQRDALLESHGLESRKLAELLEKERQAHRNTKNQFDTFQKTHQHVTRTMTSQDARILDLETNKAQDKKRLAQLEASFKEQLTERNNLLLLLWTRLSAICGTDWAHDNSLINGRALPSLEAVTNMLPGFSKNLMAAVKTIEGMIGNFQGRIKTVEKDLWREYQALEGHLEQRTKKLDRLESIVRNGIATGTIGTGDAQVRMQRLEEAYRQLKVENQTLRTAAEVRARAAYAASGDTGGAVILEGRPGEGSPSPSVPTGPRDRPATAVQRPSTSRIPRTGSSRGGNGSISSRTSTMVRSHTAGSGVGLGLGEQAFNLGAEEMALADPEDGQPQQNPGSDNRWMLRLRDLEYKLKAEREARLLDRTEAVKRLTSMDSENATLRQDLEREKTRRRKD